MSKLNRGKLFIPGNIGNCEVKNRILMSPIETLYASACGEVTDEIIEFYRRRAIGGVGMVVLHSVQGNTTVDPFDPYAGSLRIDNNAFIPRLSDLSEAVHFAGAKIGILVSIGGGAKAASENYLTSIHTKGICRVAPSAIVSDSGEVVARELTLEDIEKIIAEFGKCALRAREAGFDVFYIHALGSYLLAEFLSPLFNHREDEYGGSAENRWKLLFQLIESCRRYAGDDFPIVVRLSADECHPAGRQLSETLEFLPKLAQAGVATLDITVGLMEPIRRSLQPIYTPKGINWDIIKRAKSAVSIPIICSGKLHFPDFAEEVIEENIADFISIGRGLVAEPDWPKKVYHGTENSLRKCLSCNYCIGQRIMKHLPIRCAFNPTVGHERFDLSLRVQKLDRNNKVAIIGAGPAGLEAASTLGRLGFKVDVFEATDHVCGGQLLAAQVPPGKSALQSIADYYWECIRNLPNVAMHFHSPISLADAILLDADYYIIATGAQPFVPKIEGIETPGVILATEALLGKHQVGQNVIVLGGGQVGAETAHWLCETGRNVTIIEMLPQIIMQEEPITRTALLHILSKYNVRMETNKKVRSVCEGRVYAENLLNGKIESFTFDNVLLAFGMKPVNDLYDGLKKRGREVMVIGDAHHVGNIASAIAEANALASQLAINLQ